MGLPESLGNVNHGWLTNAQTAAELDVKQLCILIQEETLSKY